jgi:CHAD domain-containing protein
MATPDDPVDDPLAAYLRKQAQAVLAGLSQLPDADTVHPTRVAVRRLRSTLRTFAPLIELPPDEARRADEELRWFAGLLGVVRERQVQRARFSGALAELPPEHVLGPVAVRIDGTLLGEQAKGETAVGEALASARGRALRRLLEGWLSEPPVGDTDPGAVRKRGRKAARKAVRRLEAVCPGGADADLHRARKAAKRARYAAEVLLPLGAGKKQRKRFKKAQGVLGAHRDAVVAQETLRRLVSGVPAGESGFTFGLLHAREQSEAARLHREACGLAARLFG